MSVIGVDAKHAFAEHRTGTETYAFELLSRIAKLPSEHQFRFYLNQNTNVATSEVVEMVEINWPRLWTQGGLALELWRNPVDLLFIPAHVIPFLMPTSIPTVVTVHDLRTEFLPQHSSVIQKIYLNEYTERLRALKATKLIAVSHATKKDIIERLGVSDDKVEVIYEGVDRERFNFDVKKDQETINKMKSKYGIENNYIFFIGTVQPRKNLVRLIQAFAEMKAKYDGILVLAGKKGWMSDDIYREPVKLGIKQRVKFVDYVDVADVPYMYAGADLFAFPSLYEGFGLPVLESFAVGTPVVTSNVASLPEVGGDFASYVDPEDVVSIRDGMIGVLNKTEDLSLNERLSEHLDLFSWNNAAIKTLDLFNRVIHES